MSHKINHNCITIIIMKTLFFHSHFFGPSILGAYSAGALDIQFVTFDDLT